MELIARVDISLCGVYTNLRLSKSESLAKNWKQSAGLQPLTL